MEDEIPDDEKQGAPSVDPADLVSRAHRSIGLYIDSSKTYMQLATGSLALSVTFSKGMSGSELLTNLYYLWGPWLCWFVALLAGSWYQFSAAKWLEGIESRYLPMAFRPKVIWRNRDTYVMHPHHAYNALLISFYAGVIWFAVAAGARVVNNPEPEQAQSSGTNSGVAPSRPALAASK